MEETTIVKLNEFFEKEIEAFKKGKPFSFGTALQLISDGKTKVAREGWNGKNMFIYFREGRRITGVDVNTPMKGDFDSLGHYCMRTATGEVCVGWLASQTDMAAHDWVIVE